MGKIKLISFLLITCLLFGCSSSRTFQYQFNDINRQVIRYTLAHGKIACENCYLNGACVQIVDSVLTKDRYELIGKCALYSYRLTTESLHNGSEIKIKVKCSLLVGRSKTSENYFLDEVAGALFEANEGYMKSKIGNDKNEQQHDK